MTPVIYNQSGETLHAWNPRKACTVAGPCVLFGFDDI